MKTPRIEFAVGTETLGMERNPSAEERERERVTGFLNELQSSLRPGGNNILCERF